MLSSTGVGCDEFGSELLLACLKINVLTCLGFSRLVLGSISGVVDSMFPRVSVDGVDVDVDIELVQDKRGSELLKCLRSNS